MTVSLISLSDLEDHAPSGPSDEEFFGQGGYNAVGRFQAGLLEIPVDASNGEPSDEPGDIVFIPISNSSDGSVVNGYPTSVTVSPESDFYLSTHEGTHAVVVTSASNDGSEPGFSIVTGNESEASSDNALNFSFRDHEVVARIEGAGAHLSGQPENRRWLPRGIKFKTLSRILQSHPSSHGMMPCCDFPTEDDIALEPLVISTQHRLPPKWNEDENSSLTVQMHQCHQELRRECATCHAEGRNTAYLA